MADESYESELNRAELLGIEPQEKTEWESANKARKASQEIESTEVVWNHLCKQLLTFQTKYHLSLI